MRYLLSSLSLSPPHWESVSYICDHHHYTEVVWWFVREGKWAVTLQLEFHWETEIPLPLIAVQLFLSYLQKWYQGLVEMRTLSIPTTHRISGGSMGSNNSMPALPQSAQHPYSLVGNISSTPSSEWRRIFTPLVSTKVKWGTWISTSIWKYKGNIPLHLLEQYQRRPTMIKDLSQI